MSGGDLLKRHLAWVEQDKLEVSEKLFGFDYQEKKEYEHFVDGYLKTIKDVYGEVTVDAEDMPFVTITSVVTVMDETEGERMAFKIVSPNDDASTEEVVLASYLSKVGRAMLLKAKNERVEVHTPQGVFYYRIERIKM